jgi:hypothetical protein
MTCDLIEGSLGRATGVMGLESRDGRELLGEIFAMRQCNAPLTGGLRRKNVFQIMAMALKASRKPIKLRELARAPSGSVVA